MRYGFTRIGWAKSAMAVAGLALLFGNATQAHAQWGYVQPLGYAVPGAPVYAYRPVAVFQVPVMGYVSPMAYASPVAYPQPVVVPQPYVAYSNPAIYAPAPVAVRDRVHYGTFGGRVENYNVWGPGGHTHVHARDGWLGHHDRVRYHY
ncbi:MAG: hypothetical protein JWM11_5609 [Planctomycetaceae bacterium]|nr:hypothetical protein [Planctomycetaceae bacterium]